MSRTSRLTSPRFERTGPPLAPARLDNKTCEEGVGGGQAHDWGGVIARELQTMPAPGRTRELRMDSGTVSTHGNSSWPIRP